jgi:hypothetical protein
MSMLPTVMKTMMKPAKKDDDEQGNILSELVTNTS